MISLGQLTLIVDRRLTGGGNGRASRCACTRKRMVSRGGQPLLFCIYETQSLDLFISFVSIYATNLSEYRVFRLRSSRIVAVNQQRLGEGAWQAGSDHR
jgi:hypothetical protein